VFPYKRNLKRISDNKWRDNDLLALQVLVEIVHAVSYVSAMQDARRHEARFLIAQEFYPLGMLMRVRNPTASLFDPIFARHTLFCRYSNVIKKYRHNIYLIT